MPSYRCPKCSLVITAEPDANGVLACTCGAKLRTRPAAPAPPPPAPVVAPPPPAPPPPAPEPPPAAARGPVPADASTIDALLAEIRAVRDTQEQILELLRSRPAAAPAAPAFGFGVDDDDAPAAAAPVAPTPLRSRRSKTVLLIDDQLPARQAAVAAMEKAEIPVRAVGEGNAALGAIAEEKPDVIVIDLAMGGSTSGKDVINMIKATMEWVDIPIVLYTHVPVGGQDARTVHGADEIVAKSEGPAALASRVIALFRR